MKKGNSSPGQHRRGRDKAPLTGRPRDSSGKGIKSHFHPFLAPSPGFSGCPCSLGRPADPARPFRPFRPKSKSTKGTQSGTGGETRRKTPQRIPPCAHPTPASNRDNPELLPPQKKTSAGTAGSPGEGNEIPQVLRAFNFQLGLDLGLQPDLRCREEGETLGKHPAGPPGLGESKWGEGGAGGVKRASKPERGR